MSVQMIEFEKPVLRRKLKINPVFMLLNNNFLTVACAFTGQLQNASLWF